MPVHRCRGLPAGRPSGPEFPSRAGAPTGDTVLFHQGHSLLRSALSPNAPQQGPFPSRGHCFVILPGKRVSLVLVDTGHSLAALSFRPCGSSFCPWVIVWAAAHIPTEPGRGWYKTVSPAPLPCSPRFLLSPLSALPLTLPPLSSGSYRRSLLGLLSALQANPHPEPETFARCGDASSDRANFEEKPSIRV